MTKKHKDIFIGIIIGSLIFSYIPAFAQNIIEVSLANYTIKINGTTVEPENQPLLYQDRTYVPLRFIAEALDKDVGFEDGIIEINDKVIENQQIQQQSQKITQKEDNQTQNKKTGIPKGFTENIIRWIGFYYNDNIYINSDELYNLLYIIVSSPYKNIIEFKNINIDADNKYVRYTRDFLNNTDYKVNMDPATYYNFNLFKDILLDRQIDDFLEKVEENKMY